MEFVLQGRSNPQNSPGPLVEAHGDGVDGNDDPFKRSHDISRTEIEDGYIAADECERVGITDDKALRQGGKPKFVGHHVDDFGRIGSLAGYVRLPGDDAWPVVLAGDSDKGHLILEDFVLESEPLKVFKGKSRLQCWHAKFKGNDVSGRCGLGEFQPSAGDRVVGQVMFPSAFFHRLQPFEESVGFTCPFDDAAETFVVNRPFVDFAIRSTWAYASCEVRNDFVERPVAIRAR